MPAFLTFGSALGASIPVGHGASRLTAQRASMRYAGIGAGTLTIEGPTFVRLVYTFDAGCLAALYPGLGGASADTCSLIGPGMMGAMPASDESSASCVLAGTGCACEFASAPEVSASGPYTASNGQLTVEGESLDYCVSGDELRLGVRSVGGSIARRQ